MNMNSVVQHRGVKGNKGMLSKKGFARLDRSVAKLVAIGEVGKRMDKKRKSKKEINPPEFVYTTQSFEHHR